MKATKLMITLDLENDAFAEPGPEINLILRELAVTLEDFNGQRDGHDHPLLLHDSNGNTVGTVTTS